MLQIALKSNGEEKPVTGERRGGVEQTANS